jgi:trans-aconitate methyltransferase
MQKFAYEPRVRVWNRHYEKQRIPWSSRGLSAPARTLLTKYTTLSGPLLEIGCGTGNDTNALVGLGFKYTGLDFSEAAINEASNRHPRCDFFWSDFFKWKTEKAFDVIYEKGFFHGLRGVRRRNSFIRRAASHLTQNGIWLSICGAADHRHSNFAHPALYLRDLIGPAEIYFEVMEVVKADYGLAELDNDFKAWHVIFKRR